MRADRLVSIVLLLRQRGRMSVQQLATELEVSARTVLRDIDALSGAGVPVYTERGRHGGVRLLPGFRTELTGLNHDETLALLTAGARQDSADIGLGPALSSALRKVVDALPEGSRRTADTAVGRLLVEPGFDLLSRSTPSSEVAVDIMRQVRRAVVDGTKLRVRYAPANGTAGWRVVDPIGLVTVRRSTYLLALRDGADRTYRLSRILAAHALEIPADRPDHVDLEELWRQRREQFLSDNHLNVRVRVRAARREELLDSAVAAHQAGAEGHGWLRLDVTFQDLRHAEWALWQLGTDAEPVDEPTLTRALHTRAAHLVQHYRNAMGSVDDVDVLHGLSTGGEVRMPAPVDQVDDQTEHQPDQEP